MKGKWKSSNKKLGFPTALLLCSLAFLAFFFQDAPIIRPKPRMLEVVHEKEYPDPMRNGVSGESSIDSIPFQILSWRPRAYYFPNFATAEQCERVTKMAKVNLKPSGLALRKGEAEESTNGTRTSLGTFLSASEDKTETLNLIEKKIVKVTSIPQSHGESFNILRYEIGQNYDSHYNSFNQSEYGPQSSQRNDRRVKGYNYRQCVGLKIKPRRGDGLVLYSLFLNGTIDPASLHGSCPVIKGEKWVATKWIRDQDQNDYSK